MNNCVCKAHASGTDCEKELLSLLGNPQDKLRFIHVAGTNGKGSFCSMMSSVLQKQGYKVGLYTSPYIVVFNDRIRVNGLPIAEDDITDLFLRVRQKADTMKTPPSSFDFITRRGIFVVLRDKVRHSCA